MANIRILGFNLSVSGDTVTATPYAINSALSQYEEAYLEVTVEGVTEARSVCADFTLPDGAAIKGIHFEPKLGEPNKFRVRLTEVLGNKLTIGTTNDVLIKFTIKTPTTEISTNAEEVGIYLYKTNTDITYHPNDIDVLFVSLNKTQLDLADLEISLEENKAGISNIDNRLADLEQTVDDMYTNEGVVDVIDQHIENNVGREQLLTFDAVLNENTIIGRLESSLQNYEMKNGVRYLFDIVLPVVDELPETASMILLDKDNNTIKINTVFNRNITTTATVHDMRQVEEYNESAGYRWKFFGYYTIAGEDKRNVYTEAAVNLSKDLEPYATKVDLQTKADLVNGKIPSSQLPSYVDDVIEGYYYNNKFYKEESHTTEITGESGKIYTDINTNKTYRWSGTTYTEISSSLALGETAGTAYAGNKGKANADAIAEINRKIEEGEIGGSVEIITLPSERGTMTAEQFNKIWDNAANVIIRVTSAQNISINMDYRVTGRFGTKESGTIQALCSTNLVGSEIDLMTITSSLDYTTTATNIPTSLYYDDSQAKIYLNNGDHNYGGIDISSLKEFAKSYVVKTSDGNDNNKKLLNSNDSITFSGAEVENINVFVKEDGGSVGLKDLKVGDIIFTVDTADYYVAKAYSAASPSVILRKFKTKDYLPLTGGTITGNLKLYKQIPSGTAITPVKLELVTSEYNSSTPSNISGDGYDININVKGNSTDTLKEFKFRHSGLTCPDGTQLTIPNGKLKGTNAAINIDDIATKEEAAALAAGKTASYVISYGEEGATDNNSKFKTNEPTVTFTDTELTASNTITTVNSKTVNLTELNIGDIVYIVETDIPDWFVITPYNAEDAEPKVVFSKMETSKIDVSGNYLPLTGGTLTGDLIAPNVNISGNLTDGTNTVTIAEIKNGLGGTTGDYLTSSDVVGNNGEAVGETLKSLKIGDKNYNVEVLGAEFVFSNEALSGAQDLRTLVVNGDRWNFKVDPAEFNEFKESVLADIEAYKAELKAYADQKVADIVGQAPEAYDTLKEISDYISEDTTNAASMLASIQENTTAITTKANIGDSYTKTESDGKYQLSTTAYNKSNIVYSTTEPTNPVEGMIWLEPVN